jgi:hypothetical protein
MVLLHSFSQEMGGDARGASSLSWLSWLPLATGVAGIGGVLINRLASGVSESSPSCACQGLVPAILWRLHVGISTLGLPITL